MRSDLCIRPGPVAVMVAVMVAVRVAVRVAVLAAVTAAGCATARTVIENSATDRFGADADELDFWDVIATQRVVTNHDALYGLLLAASGAAPEGYEARLEEARRRGWIAGARTPPANESATVGMIAVAACDLIDAGGGLVMRLLGPAPRSCTREIVYLDLLPPRTENQSMTGLEFIDLLSRIEQFNREEDT